jgi:NAD(P)-dependent dehydrogenase (short-subunit alcohol dehydrogenase family)
LAHAAADVLFAVAATARWAGDGITANALMPGVIATNLQQSTSRRSVQILRQILR